MESRELTNQELLNVLRIVYTSCKGGAGPGIVDADLGIGSAMVHIEYRRVITSRAFLLPVPRLISQSFRMHWMGYAHTANTGRKVFGLLLLLLASADHTAVD